MPQTITVIPRAVIEQQGATTLRDVLRNVAGITFQAGEGGVPAGDQLTIRGFSARTDMFIDGVRDFGGYSRDSFNLEQVEVAKGPASALAGRGSTGGAINQVSKAPMRGADRRRDASAPATPTTGARTLDINQPLDDFAVPGRRFASTRCGPTPTCRAATRDERALGRRAVAGFGVGHPTRVTVSYFHLEQDNLPDYGLPWVPATPTRSWRPTPNGAPPVDQSNFYGLDDPRLREDRHRHRHRRASSTTLAPPRDAAQPDALGPATTATR